MPVVKRSGSVLVWLSAIVIAGLILALVVVTRRSDNDREIEGSGVVATQTRHVPAFRAVALDGVGMVTIRAGARASLTVRGDDNIVRRVTTRVHGDLLTIGLRGQVRPRRPLHVTVASPAIDALDLRGSGTVMAAGVKGRTARVTLSGTGIVRASGAVTRLDVEMNGVGEAQLAGLRAQVVSVRINGTGRVEVDAERTLDATVAGAGEVCYRGAPERVRSQVEGVGAITKAP